MKTSLKKLREAIRSMIAEDFETSFGVKKKWVDVTSQDVTKDPELGDEIMDMLRKTYEPIGGHLKLKTVGDVFKQGQVVDAIDIDDDPQADAFNISKMTSSGRKSVASGTDGGSEAKSSLLTKKAGELFEQGNYAEVSGAVAHILLSRFKPPVVDNQQAVEKALGEPVEWLGAHPDGKYPGIIGWYSRSIGGQVVTKIMLGKPN